MWDDCRSNLPISREGVPVLLLQTSHGAQSSWDSARDWISALGSLGAALFAAVAFFWSLRGRRERAWIAASRQASRVVAWLDIDRREMRFFGEETARVLGIRDAHVVCIQNSSDEPVFDCKVTVNLHADDRKALGTPRLEASRKVVPPGQAMVEMPELATCKHRPELPMLQFTDGANTQWLRSSTGRLAMVLANPAKNEELIIPGWQRPFRRGF